MGLLQKAGLLVFYAALTAAWGLVLAWGLSWLAPFRPTYGGAALWGLMELGLIGLILVASLRSPFGLGVFLATLVAGPLWGMGCLALLQGLGAPPGPYLFSAAFMGPIGALVAVGILLPRRPRA